MTVENESAGIKCSDCYGDSLMLLLDLGSTSVVFPPVLCSPHHTNLAYATFCPTIVDSQSLAWIRSSWNKM